MLDHPFVAIERHLVARIVELGGGDQRTLHVRDLEFEPGFVPLERGETNELLPQIGYTGAIGSTITASSALHGALLDWIGKETWGSHRLFSSTVEDGKDYPEARFQFMNFPTGFGLCEIVDRFGQRPLIARDFLAQLVANQAV